MKTNIFLLALIALLATAACRKDNVDPTSQKEVRNAIEDIMDRQDLNSIAFSVTKGSDVLWAEAMGYADAEGKIAATTDTRYLLASVSKTVTAVALMQLVEDGQITLDEDINTHLPFIARNPDYPSTSITYRMLLAHASSISDNHQNTLDLYCYGSDCSMSMADFFDAVFIPGGSYFSADNFSSAEPGTVSDYSNLGSALIGYLVERISGMPFDQYCKQHIFSPLGMNHTEWRLADSPLSETATPISNDLTGSSPHYTFPDYPNGGLRASANDLSRFWRAIIQGGSLDGTTILSPQTVQSMFSLQFGFGDQCLAFYYETVDGMRLLGHSGGEMGVTTEMYHDPATGTGVLVLNNNDDADLSMVVSYLMQYGNAQ